MDLPPPPTVKEVRLPLTDREARTAVKLILTTDLSTRENMKWPWLFKELTKKTKQKGRRSVAFFLLKGNLNRS